MLFPGANGVAQNNDAFGMSDPPLPSFAAVCMATPLCQCANTGLK
jgi:hypothetical protein